MSLFEKALPISLECCQGPWGLQPGMDTAEKTDGSGHLHTGMNDTAAGHEFNDTESMECIK